MHQPQPGENPEPLEEGENQIVPLPEGVEGPAPLKSDSFGSDKINNYEHDGNSLYNRLQLIEPASLMEKEEDTVNQLKNLTKTFMNIIWFWVVKHTRLGTLVLPDVNCKRKDVYETTYINDKNAKFYNKFVFKMLEQWNRRNMDSEEVYTFYLGLGGYPMSGDCKNFFLPFSSVCDVVLSYSCKQCGEMKFIDANVLEFDGNLSEQSLLAHQAYSIRSLGAIIKPRPIENLCDCVGKIPEEKKKELGIVKDVPQYLNPDEIRVRSTTAWIVFESKLRSDRMNPLMDEFRDKSPFDGKLAKHFIVTDIDKHKRDYFSLAAFIMTLSGYFDENEGELHHSVSFNWANKGWSLIDLANPDKVVERIECESTWGTLAYRAQTWYERVHCKKLDTIRLYAVFYGRASDIKSSSEMEQTLYIDPEHLEEQEDPGRQGADDGVWDFLDNTEAGVNPYEGLEGDWVDDGKGGYKWEGQQPNIPAPEPVDDDIPVAYTEDDLEVAEISEEMALAHGYFSDEHGVRIFRPHDPVSFYYHHMDLQDDDASSGDEPNVLDQNIDADMAATSSSSDNDPPQGPLPSEDEPMPEE